MSVHITYTVVCVSLFIVAENVSNRSGIYINVFNKFVKIYVFKI